MSLQDTEEAGAKHATEFRITLKFIEASIIEKRFFNAGKLARYHDSDVGRPMIGSHPLDVMTICILTMKNGFSVIGKSSPLSPENFNEDVGRKFSYEDCVRQLWPLYAFARKQENLPDGWIC
jgi:Phage protein (N4 Gp49/phage Sf6 gene 66) family